MPMMLQGGPFKAPVAGFHRFTVKQYHKMIADGVLTEDDRVELLEGYLVDKMPHDPIHDGTIQKINRRLVRAIPAGWEVRVQSAVTLSQSEPEPDLALVREDRNGFMNRHPGISDFGILIEVSNSTLDTDRGDKGAIYARAGLPEYWIVNVLDLQIEVFERPSGASADPSYTTNRIFKRGSSIPLVLNGITVALIPVDELLP